MRVVVDLLLGEQAALVSPSVKASVVDAVRAAADLPEGHLMGHVHTDGSGEQPPEPIWSVPGQRPASALSGSGPAGLVPRAATLFTAFVTETEHGSPAEQVVAMRQLIDQYEALWLGAAADLDATGAIADAGFGSLASWLRHTCRMAPGEAAGRAKAATAVTGELGATAQAMLAGTVTWRHALVIDQTLANVPVEHRDEAERSLVEHAGALDPGQLRRVGDRLVHCFDRQRADEAAIRKLDRRGLSVAETMDGMVSVNGLLDPVTGALLMTALDAKLRPAAGPDQGDGHGHDPEPI